MKCYRTYETTLISPVKLCVNEAHITNIDVCRPYICVPSFNTNLNYCIYTLKDILFQVLLRNTRTFLDIEKDKNKLYKINKNRSQSIFPPWILTNNYDNTKNV